MENQAAAEVEALNNNHNDLIDTFSEITSSSKEEALFFLESHNFDLDSAVSTFLETTPATTTTAAAVRNRSPSLSPSPATSLESSPSRSRSSSPPSSQPRNLYNLRSKQQKQSSNDKNPSGSRRSGRIRTFSDLNRMDGDDSDSDSDEHQEYYTGGEKSGMLVQDPSKGNGVDTLFDQARQAGAVEATADHLRPSSSSRSFSGSARLLSGETVPSTPLHLEAVTRNITFWTNGFTVDDGPLRRLDDPENASFLKSISKSECPEELKPADRRTKVHVNLMRRVGDCPTSKKPRLTFQGVGRTLASTDNAVPPMEPTVAVSNFNTLPLPSRGLVVDQMLPSTSIQLRLTDGTRMVSRFNHHHTIRDIRGFLDASRPAAPRTYQLLTMGFPPKQLEDLDQTIEQAGLANSVVIQKL